MTAGLSSAPACVRLIVRDIAGKHSWDSAVLFGPPPGSPSSPAHAHIRHTHVTHIRPTSLEEMSVDREHMGKDMEEEQEGAVDREEDQEYSGGGEKGGGGREADQVVRQKDTMGAQMSPEGGSGELLSPPSAKRVCWEVAPAWDSLRDGEDALDEMLQYLGYSSPECLQRTGG